jgi:3-dehydroquinate dehydratase-2
VKILVLHGPNLNLLGTREPEVYGKATLEEIDRSLESAGKALQVEVECRQSNQEGELISWIQEALGTKDGILINPAGYTHTSVAIRDALLAVGLPTVEVHMSNPHSRETFRHQSFIEDVVIGRVMGFQKESYLFGLQGLVMAIREN